MRSDDSSPYGNGPNGYICKSHHKSENWSVNTPKTGLMRCKCGIVASMNGDGKALSENN